MSLLSVLIDECRSVVKDESAVTSEQLWSDTEWIEYFNSAENEICERAHVLEDSDTGSVCTITLIDGTATYSLSPLILFIESILPSYDNYINITKRTEAWLDKNYNGWRELEDGMPEILIEKQTNKITLVPAPGADEDTETLTLTVKRRPLVAMTVVDDTPELTSIYYTDMKNWALHRAFSKRDAEIYDEQKATYFANYYYTLFESRVGPRPTANIQRILKQEAVTGVQIMPFRR